MWARTLWSFALRSAFLTLAMRASSLPSILVRRAEIRVLTAEHLALGLTSHFEWYLATCASSLARRASIPGPLPANATADMVSAPRRTTSAATFFTDFPFVGERFSGRKAAAAQPSVRLSEGIC